ncbi:MAG: VWA domain-containing protein [Candidatus Omnitrophica bacterium]|nr:VWA domain-containing protein [Candidatus Omnitrophota bacterium]MDD5488680.1 VWA domain-containing protein [Candidatus Omnitrophota bacterium]
MSMHFADPVILTVLACLLPLLVVFIAWSAKNRTKILAKFAQPELLPKIIPFYSRDRRLLRYSLEVAALALIIIALARPQWGFFWKENKKAGLDLLVAVDTSKSMLTVDIKPDRLTFVKNELKHFIKGLRGDRTGLIAFSGEAFLLCPFTMDHSGYILAVNSLDTNSIPTGGTSIPSAIDEALKAYKAVGAENKLMVLITDGDNTEGDIEKAIQEAKKENVTVSCIGIGTDKGDLIPVLDEKGQMTYVKNSQGVLVKSRLMEDVLKGIAEDTGGIYVRASQEDLGLNAIYDDYRSRFTKSISKEPKTKVLKERYQLFLLAGILFLISEIILSAVVENE